MKNVWWKQQKYQIAMGVAACLVLIFLWFKSETISSFYGAEGYGYIRPADGQCTTIDAFVNATTFDAKDFEPVYGPRPKTRTSELPWPKVFGFTIDMKQIATRKFSVLDLSTKRPITKEYPDLRKSMDACLHDPNSYKTKMENNTISKNTFCNMIRHDLEKILKSCGKHPPSPFLDSIKNYLPASIREKI
jgi:hypothetical protein